MTLRDIFHCFMLIFVIPATILIVSLTSCSGYIQSSPTSIDRTEQSMELLYSVGDIVKTSTAREKVVIIGYYNEYPQNNLPTKGDYDYIGVSYINGFTGRENLYCFTEDDIEDLYFPIEDEPIGSVVQLDYIREPVAIIGFHDENIKYDSLIPNASISPNAYRSNTISTLYDKINVDYVGVSYYNGYTGDKYLYAFMEDNIEGSFVDGMKTVYEVVEDSDEYKTDNNMKSKSRNYNEGQKSYKVGDKVQVNDTMIITGYNQIDPTTDTTYDYSGLLLSEDSLGTEYYYFNEEDIVTKID